MKIKKILSLAMLAAVTMTGLSGCKKGVEAGGESVVQIRCYKGGYNDAFIRELIAQFNNTFKSRGISAQLVESGELVTEKSKQEIFDYKNNQIDLYLTNGLDYSNVIAKSQSTLRTTKNTLLADLDDVLTSKAIGLNGKEEQKTIGERLFQGIKETAQYNGTLPRWQGKVFKLPWADAMTGLFVNKKVLDQHNIEIPLTSNEFQAAIEQLSNISGVYPYSFGGSNASGYWAFLFETWFAQYSGQDKYIDWMKCTPNHDGVYKTEGWKVYQDQGILESLKAMFPILDLKYAKNGSASMQHTKAQIDFVNGVSAFMLNGDWVMREMYDTYPDKINDIIMIPVPILSKIGADFGLTDAQLHDVVAGIDDDKTDAQIKSSVPAATDAAIAKIRDARSIHDSIGAGHDMFIPSYSDAVDAAKLFIRFMYSNDGCNIFREKALANLPLEYTVKHPDLTSNYQASLDKISKGGKAKVISDNAEYNSVRSTAQIFKFNYSAWQSAATFVRIMEIKHSGGVIVNGQNVFNAQYMFEKEAEYVQSIWSAKMRNVL